MSFKVLVVLNFIYFLCFHGKISVLIWVQNAKDNDYAPDVQPSLEFVFTTEDVAGVGAPATLLVFNNEIGFQKQNIDSICSLGRSTKTNDRGGGYIGEKGIKHIFSHLVPAMN